MPAHSLAALALFALQFAAVLVTAYLFRRSGTGILGTPPIDPPVYVIGKITAFISWFLYFSKALFPSSNCPHGNRESDYPDGLFIKMPAIENWPAVCRVGILQPRNLQIFKKSAVSQYRFDLLSIGSVLSRPDQPDLGHRRHHYSPLHHKGRGGVL